LIPLTILNAHEGKQLPVYGDGKNVRDWLHVEDHCSAIWLILQHGIAGETYNVGGECEKRNIDVVHAICDVLEELSPAGLNPALRKASPAVKRYRDLITFVPDRPGHDRRYAIDCKKIKKELGWKQRYGFSEGLKQTISWYLNNTAWVESIRSGEYLRWIDKNYTQRNANEGK
jgi:dTDP-glucose 4,6-dehydratase